LLVVIAIIAILISILLPVTANVRRRAVVLVSPVAFRNIDDGTLHLTDLRGQNDLQITPGYPYPYEIFGGMWSPSGQRIGYQVLDHTCKELSTLCIVTPATGTIYKHPALCPDPGREWLFGGWIDDDNFVESGPTIYIRNCKTGAVVRSFQPDGEKIPEGPFVWTGLGWNQRYITVGRKRGYDWAPGDGVVRFARGDLTAGTTIWQPAPFKNGILYGSRDALPSVDPLGECIMFLGTLNKGPADPNLSLLVFKYRDGHTPMSALGGSVGATANWLDDGNFLTTNFCIYKKTGELVRLGNIQCLRNVYLRRYWNNAP
jgi:hypothetical protein